mmetsp:Transcript_1954/g.2415  ORF Transcript_1954/g.2415 Transcript_1954/m.2415 type:complete len:375 (+) Transcript_1954:122-1246(+)
MRAAVETSQSKRLPLLSSMILFVMDFIACLLSFLPEVIQMHLSTFMIGGLFGLMLFPIMLMHGLLCACDALFPTVFPQFVYIYGGLAVLYIVTVLMMDKSAVIPPKLGVVRHHKETATWIEKRSASFWNTHFDYFPMKLTVDKETKLDKNQQYLFAVHPHGIHCVPLDMVMFPNSPFDQKFQIVREGKITGLVASIMFRIPVVRELFLNMGYVDASRKVAHKVLSNGRNITVCTGGEEESMRTVVGKDCVVLKKRKGFVRLAISHGAALVPVFGIGNNDLFQTYSFLIDFRMWLQKKTGIALPIFHGRFGTPLPYRREINVVIGDPIHIDPKHIPDQKGDKPSDDIVNLYHAKYIEALKTLHKKHGKGRPLVIY